ncbi:protein translocase subunit SecF [candidate division TA06 bacterium]|uniref:Protein-export membrane protein SecF n=1 Tax=candidate division TA06 bacterium TaxID=2250710 RepID=A0A933IFL6_UNCT6|nr:protein translocase subunit SecF [candidate division TA06 bacterium]
MPSLFKHQTNIGFIKNRYTAYIVSLAIFAIAIGSVLFHGGLKLGVDFTGGTLLQIHFKEAISTDELRQALSQAGLAGAEIQKIKDTGLIKNAFLIRTGLKEKQGSGQQTIAQKVSEALGQKYPQNAMTVDSDETVGPKIGKELQLSAFWAVMAGLLAILIYVAFRFDFRFGAAAVVSLFHDVLCTIGFISITGMEFNLQSVAVLLTIVGYSINDSIVVADRIRENIKKPHKDTFAELVNRSLNETLSRTVVTVLTVLLVLVSLQLFAGRILQDFTKPLLFGLVIGTYSSIFVVASLVVDWEIKSPSKRRK